MIRSDSVNGPFSRSRCPFDDEGEQCKRPFCPFFHPFTGASKMLIKVKEEVQDDDIIVVLEKVGPPRSSLTSQVESPPIAPNTVMTQQSQYDPIPSFFFTSTVLSSLDQYACGYLGYLAPNISADEHVNPPIHEHILSSHKLTQVNEQSTSGLPRVLNNSSKAKDIGSGSISLSHHKKQKEKLASAPSYTPTPIVQLEREEEERKKRRELAERQKNIRNRLKRQDLAKSKQNNNKNIVDKNVIDPIDQIMVTQEILLKDQREQKLEELAKIEVEKKRHKERMEKQDEMKKNKKGIKLKSGETCSGLILAGAPRNIMKISNCKQQDLKRSDELNCKSNDDVWLSKKSSSDIMEEYEKKVEDWKEKINKPIEKAAKERTVIDDILTTKRQQHSTSSFNNDFGNASKKLCFYNILDQKKKKSRLNEKCEFGINENVKMLSNIDKSIGILEEEIRQSNNKSNKSSQPSASVSNELKLNLKNYIDEKKKVPIWRKKSNAPTDIILENKLNNVRKSSDDIINSLFEGDEVESSTKKDNNKKKHFYESINLVHKRQRTSSNNERNKKQKLENEEDSEILKEKQALVDLLSDNVLTPTMSLSSTSSVSVVPATPSPVASPTQKPKSPIQLNVKNSSNNTFHSEIPSTISTNLNCSINNNNFSDIKHTLPSTLKKSEQRKAHLNISSKGDQQKLFPLDPNNKKVSIQIRQTKLRIIYEEYIKICANDPKLAIESAQREEKEVLDRCSTKNGYISAIPNLIKRLRNFATNNSIPKSSSGITISYF